MSQRNITKYDPARSINLLWGSQSIPGRSGLTIKTIVTVAIEIADAEGIDKVSMRNVAERLGVGTMSLYTYIPGKTELLDLMIDTTYANLYNSVNSPTEEGGDWREGIRIIANINWNLYRKHPWMLDLNSGREVLGPHACMKYETELRVLDRIGLTDIEMDSILNMVTMHVKSCARLQASIETTQQLTSMNEKEWWLASAPTLSKFINPEQFPVASRVGNSSGNAYQGVYDSEHAYRFGIERIIDGTSILISSRQRQASSKRR